MPIKNCILIAGSDNFRCRERVKFYREAFKTKCQDGEIEFFDTENSVSSIQNTVFTQNLFGGRRMIIAENFWDPDKFEVAQKIDFFDKLPEFADSVTLIFYENSLDRRTRWAKFLYENAKTEMFDPFDESGVLRWIEKFAEKNGGQISRLNAKFLLERIGEIDWKKVTIDRRTGKINWQKVEQTFGKKGENLWRFSTEIQKCLDASSDGVIDEKLICEMTVVTSRAVIWDFLRNLSAKKPEFAIPKFHQLLNMGHSPYYIFSMILREIRIHSQIRSGLDQGFSSQKISAETKMHSFVLDKTLPMTRGFSFEKIKEIHNECFALDQKIKTGQITAAGNDLSAFEIALEKLIFFIAE
jgi:DNA polymerase-3 subunit delta